MLTEMQMRGFKSWANTGKLSLAPLTVFFGANSSGKSSLLQMLLLLKQTAESRDRGLVLRTNAEKDGYVNLGTVPDLIHRDDKEVEFHLQWQLPEPIQLPSIEGTERSIDSLGFQTQIYSDGDTVYVERMRYESQGLFAEMKRRSNEEGYEIEVKVNGKKLSKRRGRPFSYVSPPVKCYGFSDEALHYYQESEFLSDLTLAFERLFQKIFYLGPLREYPQRIYTWAGEKPSDVGLKGDQAIPALLAAKDQRVYPGKRRTTLERRIAEWLVKLGMAASFETKPLVNRGFQYEVRIRRTTSSPLVPITDLGFGVSQVLPVLVLCYYAPEGATIILEQPEIHLHPSVQAGLADVFLDAIKERRLQLIIESHSEHFLRRLQRRVAEEKIASTDTAIYFCELDEEGVSQISKLEMNLFGEIANWPKDFFGDMTGDMIEAAQAGLQRQIQQNGLTARSTELSG